MGNILTGKISSSLGESDSSKVTTDEMAEGNYPGDASEQKIHYQQISEEMNTMFVQARQNLEGLFSFATSLADHQRKLDFKLAKYRGRSRRLTEDHARQSESNVENIASTNRPSVLETKYKEFCDHERMDAVSALEYERLTQIGRNKWEENYMDQYIACIIFEESYQSARLLKDHFLRSMGLILMSAPSIGEQYLDQENKRTEVHFSIDTSSHQHSTIGQINQDSLKLIMNETAENCDVSAIVQRTLTSLGKTQANGALNNYSKTLWMNSSLRNYVEECCKYAWKLVCQTPPYEIEGNLTMQDKALFNDTLHQVCRSSTSSDRTPQYIYTVIWPGLFRGSPRRVIRKTEVVLIGEK